MKAPETFFEWLLLASARASVLTLLVLGLQLVLSRWLPARWRHAMWLPVILVLIAPGLPASRFSFENSFQPPPGASPAAAGVAAFEATQSERAAKLPVPTSATPSWGQILFAVWAVGGAGFLIVCVTGYRRNFGRILRGKVETGEEIHASVERVAQQLGLRRLPRVAVSTAVDSPAVAGLLTPTLLLPANFPDGFTAGEARVVLMHELTHLKRHDLQLTWLVSVLQAVHWFNPLLWVAFARMRMDRESACDAQVLAADAEDRRADYGHALIKLQSAAIPSGLGHGFAGIFARAGIRGRIQAIARHRRAHPAWGVAACAIIAGLIVTGATRSREKAEEPLVGPVKLNETSGRGRLVSFENGKLTLQSRDAVLIWDALPPNLNTFGFNDEKAAYEPADFKILSQAKPGTWIQVFLDQGAIRVGARSGSVTGTFVSYTDRKLVMIGKDINANYAKKYGNVFRIGPFFPKTPVYESIDGGPYKFVGYPEDVLGGIKEGTIITSHANGDENPTHIEIGVPK